MDFSNVHRLFLNFVYLLAFPLIFISYCAEPFTDDVLVYFGTAKVTALTPGFPMSLDAVWESRFIGHRFLYYLLNAIDPFDEPVYHIFAKMVVGLVTILIISYFSKRVSDRLNISFYYVYAFSFLGMFAANMFVIFSTEAVSVVIAMMMMAMILGDNRYLQFASGLLILPLLILKGLPVLLVGIVMLAVMMLAPSDYPDRFKRAAWSLIPVSGALIGLDMYFPHFVSDVFLIRLVNPPVFLDWYDSLYHFGYYLAGVVGMIPVIIIGICAMFLLMSVVTKEHLRDLSLLLGMWGVASIYILIIARFWYYHYYLMLIPAILTSCYFLKVFSEARQVVFVVLTSSVLVIFCILVAGWSPGMNYTGYHIASGREFETANVTSHWDILSQPSTLYLDHGTVSYYLPTPSACRYVGAFPLQRNMTASDEYWEERNCTLAYTGKYIIVHPFWIDMNTTGLDDLISRNYTKVSSMIDGNFSGEGGTVWYWDIYQRGV